MQVTVEPRENFTILHLRGEFDTFYCALLQKEVDSLIASGVTRITLNLRLVKFINSTALGAIIKASKVLSSKGGKLVVSRPSVFCKDIMEKVGLDRVVPMFDSDEAAGAALLADRSTGSRAKATSELEDDTTVLFAPTDGKRVDHFIPESVRTTLSNPQPGQSSGNWRGIGRMLALDTEGLRFTWNGGNSGLTPFEMGQMLSLGTDLTVKFRLPLLKKGHCEAVVTVSEVEERPDGVKLATTFTELEPETLAAVKQYAADMAFLKKELRSATEKR
ncbi:MAG: anti-sigma factor antagonist [Planctomycetes bacterium]|nr:anti-sigma factor antagonist [Planctomycetota bacterium]